jgi:hypothetical protein
VRSRRALRNGEARSARVLGADRSGRAGPVGGGGLLSSRFSEWLSQLSETPRQAMRQLPCYMRWDAFPTWRYAAVIPPISSHELGKSWSSTGCGTVRFGILRNHIRAARSPKPRAVDTEPRCPLPLCRPDLGLPPACFLNPPTGVAATPRLCPRHDRLTMGASDNRIASHHTPRVPWPIALTYE